MKSSFLFRRNVSQLIKNFLSIATLILAATSSIFARDLTVSTKGEGTVERSGATDNAIQTANLILERNGTFTMGLVGNVDYRFKGTWLQGADRDKMQLRITSAMGRDADGTGTLDLDDRRTGPVVGRFSIAGDGRIGLFKAHFRGDREPIVQIRGVTRPPLPPPPVLVQSLRNGTGSVRVSGQPVYRLTHAYVHLNADGSALVNVYGGATAGYIGTWQPAGANTYQLSVRGGFADERVSGAVTLSPGGRTYTRLELSGASKRVYYSLAFEPTR